MRTSRELSPPAAAVELRKPLRDGSLDLVSLFGRSAPVEVDLGCGDGSFLSEMAARHPQRDFLGIERLFGRVRSACRKISQRELSNARILRSDIAPALEHLLAPSSIEVFHLMFSDPWPKRRHQDRRIVTAEFLCRIARALKSDGWLRIVTDHSGYFAQMQRVARGLSEFQIEVEREVMSLPRSTFEEHFRKSGNETYRLVLRKVSALR